MKYDNYSCGYSTVEFKCKNGTDLTKLYALNEYQKSFIARATFEVELIDTFNININYCIPSEIQKLYKIMQTCIKFDNLL